jgi:uncharacterized membrane protein (UPF0127 family)
MRLALSLSVFFVWASAVFGTPSETQPAVKIHGHWIAVEVARSPEAWRKGLMFREKLSKGQGMLFWGTFERPQSFWMKNTLIPLDIIFISKDRRIVSIAKKTKPLSEDPIPSAAPAQHVLEILAGEADALKLKAGDRVEFLNIQD